MNNNNTQKIEIRNSFGALSLTPIMPFVPVSDISVNNYPQAKLNMVSLESAAKVALISENNKIQICFPTTTKFQDAAFVVYHDTPRTGAICAVEIDNFNTNDNTSPFEKIDQLATPSLAQLTL